MIYKKKIFEAILSIDSIFLNYFINKDSFSWNFENESNS